MLTRTVCKEHLQPAPMCDLSPCNSSVLPASASSMRVLYQQQKVDAPATTQLPDRRPEDLVQVRPRDLMFARMLKLAAKYVVFLTGLLKQLEVFLAENEKNLDATGFF